MSGVPNSSGISVQGRSNNTVPATAGSSSVGHSNDHMQERLFIGPMLFAAAEEHLDLINSHGSTKHWLLGRHDATRRDDGMNDDVPERHAFQYFRRRGGTEEAWESQESLRQR